MEVKWHVCIKHVINRIQQFSACGQLSSFEFYAIIRFERKLLFFSSSLPNTSRQESTTQYLIDREPNEEDTKNHRKRELVSDHFRHKIFTSNEKNRENFAVSQSKASLNLSLLLFFSLLVSLDSSTPSPECRTLRVIFCCTRCVIE